MIVIPKAFYGVHIWNRNGDISIYDLAIKLLHLPYYPPEPRVMILTNIPNRDIEYTRKRLTVLKQLVSSSD